jgi:SAM-dependent methyltransferase
MTDAAAAYTAQFVLASLPPGARRVLEVGCGSGAVALMLAESGLEVLALDSDPNAVELARARGVDARLASWPVPVPGRFDAVLFTRSLHHMARLDDSLAAAFDCLGDGGRVIVEDFAYDEAPEPSLRWFRSVARVVAAGGTAPPHSSLAGLLDWGDPIDEWWHREHDHDLHSAPALEAALRRRFTAVRRTDGAYYFRYFDSLLAPDSPLLAALLEHELEMIALGAIAPLGRRFVAGNWL